MNNRLRLYVIFIALIDVILLVFLLLTGNLEISEPQAAATNPPTVFLINDRTNKNLLSNFNYFNVGEKVKIEVRLRIDQESISNNYKKLNLKVQFDKRYFELDTVPFDNIPPIFAVGESVFCTGVTTNHTCVSKSFTLDDGTYFQGDTFITNLYLKTKVSSNRVLTDVWASDHTNKGVQFFSQVESEVKGIESVTKSTNSKISIGSENVCVGDYNGVVTAGRVVDLADLSTFARYYVPATVKNYGLITRELSKLKLEMYPNTVYQSLTTSLNWKESNRFDSEVTLDSITSPTNVGMSYFRVIFRTVKPDNGAADNQKSITIGKYLQSDGSVKLIFHDPILDKYDYLSVDGLTATSLLQLKFEYTYPNLKVYYKLDNQSDYILQKEFTTLFNSTYIYKWSVQLGIDNVKADSTVTAYFDNYKVDSPVGNFFDEFSAPDFNQSPQGWGNLEIDSEGRKKFTIKDFDLTNADGKNELNLQDLALFSMNYAKATCQKFRAEYIL